MAPAAWDGDGRRQYLCKRYPTVLDLALRGFAPAWLRRVFGIGWIVTNCAIGSTIPYCGTRPSPAVVSCCVGGRRWSSWGGFRPEYFLYFEDFDLSLRLAAVARLVYVPAVRVVHLGGHAARRESVMSAFSRAAARFFNRHGWRWW